MNKSIKNENIIWNYAGMHIEGLMNVNEYRNALEFYEVSGKDVIIKKLS